MSSESDQHHSAERAAPARPRAVPDWHALRTASRGRDYWRGLDELADTPEFRAYPVIFWDLFGKQGLPIRTTLTDMGPLLLSRLMDLSDAQEGVLNIAFKIARDEDLPLITLKNLQTLLEGLAARADARIQALSGGMKRRLTLARALINDPDLVFLDEPTTGLDPQARHLIWARLRQLLNQGKTIFLTTHFMDEAEYCDRVALIYRGQVIALDTPEGLQARVKTAALPNPTLEDAFIGLIEVHDQERAA